MVKVGRKLMILKLLEWLKYKVWENSCNFYFQKLFEIAILNTFCRWLKFTSVDTNIMYVAQTLNEMNYFESGKIEVTLKQK